MNLLQLRYFTTIAQLENVSRAADLLHLSQSSLSKNIAKLEAELGMSLFDRNGKKLSLNAAGTRFLDCCNLILRELEFVQDDMRLLATGTDSKIKIGTAISEQSLFSCMAAFRQVHPKTEYELTCAIESEEHVDINEFDVLVYPDGFKYEKFTGYHFCEEHFFLAVSARHPLSRSGSLTPKQLNGQDFVFLRSKKAYIEYPFRICTALAIRFGSQCYVDSQEMHRQIIRSGMAVGFVSEGRTESYRSDPSVCLIPIRDQRFSRTMMICFRREKHLSALAREFRDFAITYFSLEKSPPAVGPSSSNL